MAARRKTPRRNNHRTSNGVSARSMFVVGLMLGLLIAMAVYFAIYGDVGEAENIPAKVERGAKPESEVSLPRFEFYSILPELEVVIPERFTDSLRKILPRAQDRDEVPETPPNKPGDTYFIQTGSFKSATDAERMKVKLLLLGLDVGVTAVSVEGVRYHRVRIGPLTDYSAFQRARNHLKENNIQHLVLKSRG